MNDRVTADLDGKAFRDEVLERDPVLVADFVVGRQSEHDLAVLPPFREFGELRIATLGQQNLVVIRRNAMSETEGPEGSIGLDGSSCVVGSRSDSVSAIRAWDVSGMSEGDSHTFNLRSGIPGCKSVRYPDAYSLSLTRAELRSGAVNEPERWSELHSATRR